MDIQRVLGIQREAGGDPDERRNVGDGTLRPMTGKLSVGVTTDILDSTDHVKGVANYVRYLARELAAADAPHDFRLVHFEEGSGEPYDYGLDEIVVSRDPFLPDGASKVVANWLRGPRAVGELDVLHTTAPRVYYFPLYRALNVKTVLTVHAMDLHIPPGMRATPLGEPHAWLQQTALNYLFEATRENIDAIITVSEFLKRELVQHMDVPPDKIHPVHLAPDEKFAPTDATADSDFILSDTPEAELIDVFYELRRRGLDHRLVVFSMRGYGYERARERVAELGLEGAVDFRGYVPDDELVELYNTADVYVRLAEYEGFGLPPIEAMACGCPVITTDVGSLPEVVADAGVMLEYIDVDGFVDTIHEVLTDEERQDAMVEAGLKQAERFSWKRTARETIDVYESLSE